MIVETGSTAERSLFDEAGFGAEIAVTIAQEAFMDLDRPIVRLATSDQPIPYNPKLMEAVVPTVEKIQVEIERLLAFECQTVSTHQKSH